MRESAKAQWGGRALTAIIAGIIAVAALGATAAPSRAGVKSMIVVDAYSGRVIRAYNADASHPPASLAKMMTLYLAFEALKKGKLRWNQRVRISRHAATRMPSKIYLKPGQRVRVRDLVYATAVKSANDAAAALAEAIAGSEFRFAQLMTKRAHQIGMKSTYFGTASGLPARGQRTTARDMARLGRALILHHTKHYHIFSTRYFRYGRRTYASTNRLLRRGWGGIDGIKTGYTHRARFNLVTSARRGKKRVVTVVLGATSSRTRYRKTRWLIATGFRSRPRTRQVAAIHKPGPNQTKKTAPTAQVAAAPRFRPAGKFDSTVTDGTEVAQAPADKAPADKAPSDKNPSGKAEPKSVVVADAGKRKVDLSILGSRASAKERKAGATATKKTATADERETVVRIQALNREPKAAPKSSAAKKPRVQIAARPAPKPAPRRQTVTVTRTVYAVQVGAHARYVLAQRSAQKAFRALPGKLRRGVRVAVMKPTDYKGRFFRARIVGLSKSNADAACRYLKKKSLRCLPVRTSSRVQVASAANSPRQTVRSARAARQAPAAAAYMIQVGAVTGYGHARRLARKARGSLPRTLSRRATARILKPSSYKGRLYRVRLDGLSQEQAQKACRILKRRSVRCLPMRARADRHDRAAEPRGRYAVQVGAVNRRAKARRLVRKARRGLPRSLARQARIRILPPNTYDGRFYRARLTGLSRMEANRACTILRKKSLNCLPYRVADADA